MIATIKNIFSKEPLSKGGAGEPSLKKLAIRGSIWSLSGLGLAMAIRLGGNLVLTRLLFPEAFGLMALVNVFLFGLVMFSDFGIGPSIISDKQGDEPFFYNTAWTIQILRGAVLTLVAWAIINPYASFYGEPVLTELLPVSILVLFISGFNSTKIYTANKHLNVGRLIQVEIMSQLAGLSLMIILAWLYHSVWAFVVGSIVNATAKMILSHTYLPGIHNHFHWNTQASNKILHYGKWIFFSTIAGFFVDQGDKIMLGKLLDTGTLGIYTLALGLGAMPQMVLGKLNQRILFPLYAKRDATSDIKFRKNVFKMRSMLTSSFLLVSFFTALIGPALIGVLYDDRYQDAGLILSALAVALIPTIILKTGNIGVLAKGDSKRHFVLIGSMSIIQLGLMYLGAVMYGLWGVIAAFPLTQILVYPISVWATKKHGLWMPLHDGIAFCGFVAVALISYFYLL